MCLAAVRSSVSVVCPSPLARDLGRYLGFPMASDRTSHEKFKFLLDHVSRRLTSWKSRLLTTAGRIRMAKSVLATIPTYTMQVVWLPRRTISCLNKVSHSFIWSNNSGNRGWHRVNWETMVLPKHLGGVCLRDVNHANTSLLGKLVWSLIQEPDKLWTRVLS